MTLAALRPLLRDEPGLASVLGRQQAVLAVPDPARALVFAGLAELSRRRPIVAAVPTTADAERLAHDLGAYLGDDAVELFPAWETLPFERVSPGVETMGRRLRTLWRLRDPDRASARHRGAPSGRWCSGSARTSRTSSRSSSTRATASIVTSSWQRSSRPGYRREQQVEHRGEFAVRGSIVDVFPSTADAPVRIDLWGDEVDRLTEFSVADQRSTDRRRRGSRSSRAVSCSRTDEVRARAERLVATEPWGREQWERLAEGQIFDGMESWLPWLIDGEHVLFDLLGRRRAGPAGRAPTACATGPPTCSPRRPTWPRTPRRDVGQSAPEAEPTGSPACTCRSTGCSPTPTSRRGR